MTGVSAGTARRWAVGVPAVLAVLLTTLPLAGLLVRAPWRHPAGFGAP